MLILVATLALPCAAACNEEATAHGGAAASATATPPAAAPAPTPEDNLPSDPKNIVNIAIASKDHSTLVGALKAADYAYAVSNPGPLTVFAPTNAAFDKLPKGTVDGLLKPEKADELRNILKYHVVPSTYDAKDLKDGMTLGMVNGGKATVHVKDNKITVNDANVIATIKASNGVVHVIDAVLLPPAPK
jgi:uncharacterized surface protein with fasciclin (FAS1) repeats